MTKIPERGFFKPGGKVLVFLSILDHPLQARYYGPYEIESKINYVNYVVKIQGWREEKRVGHVNTLNEYFKRCDQNFVKQVSTFENA